MVKFIRICSFSSGSYMYNKIENTKHSVANAREFSTFHRGNAKDARENMGENTVAVQAAAIRVLYLSLFSGASSGERYHPRAACSHALKAPWLIVRSRHFRVPYASFSPLYTLRGVLAFCASLWERSLPPAWRAFRRMCAPWKSLCYNMFSIGSTARLYVCSMGMTVGVTWKRQRGNTFWSARRWRAVFEYSGFFLGLYVVLAFFPFFYSYKQSN